MYELRIAYSADSTLAEGDVHSCHETVKAAAEAFVHCTAPLKQIVVEEASGPRFLDEDEERVLEQVCSRHGFDLLDIEG
jgi:hypothetical protein